MASAMQGEENALMMIVAVEIRRHACVNAADIDVRLRLAPGHATGHNNNRTGRSGSHHDFAMNRNVGIAGNPIQVAQ